MFDIFFELFTVGMFVFIFCYTKYEIGYKIHLNILKLNNPKAHLSVKDSIDYAIPFINNGKIGALLGMNYWKNINISLAIFVASMWVITFILSLFIASIHPMLFIVANYIYWASLAAVYLADSVFVVMLCRLFEKRGLTMIIGFLFPPAGTLMLCYQVPHYFKTNRDILSGSFEVK